MLKQISKIRQTFIKKKLIDYILSASDGLNSMKNIG